MSKQGSFDPPRIGKTLASEAVGTAFLLAVVVGSGIMGERLAGGNVAIALLANSIATGTALLALIFAFAPFSGAHFNPAVTLVSVLRKELSPKRGLLYAGAQTTGAVVGVIAAHIMFSEPIVSISTRHRNTPPLYFSEFIATLGLIVMILGCARKNPSAIPYAVGGYIAAAYWFTSSTSFANPAVTLARTLSNSFAGIAPSGLLGFIVAQTLGALSAWRFFCWLDAGEPAH